MEKRVIIIILLVPLFLCWHWFEPAAKRNQKGIKAYEEQKYEDALNAFLSAKGLRPDSALLKNNTASALYQMKKYQEALEEFSKIDPEKAQLSKSQFFYNLGNSYFRMNQFDKALENYKKSLIADSGDIDTKKNYELTLKKMEEKNKQDQEKKDKKDEQDKDKEQQQQQQQQEQQQQKEKKHEDVMQYLNQNEKDQMKNKKRQVGVVRKEKDW